MKLTFEFELEILPSNEVGTAKVHSKATFSLLLVYNCRDLVYARNNNRKAGHMPLDPLVSSVCMFMSQNSKNTNFS